MCGTGTDLRAELVKSLGPLGAKGFLDLLLHHVKDLLEVLPGGAHLTPRLVHQNDAVRVELLPRNVLSILMFREI